MTVVELVQAEAGGDRYRTLQGLYDFFDEASSLPGIAEPRLGSWSAWPAAKMYLYTELLGRIAAESPESEGRSPPPTASEWARGRARLEAVAAALRFLLRLSARPSGSRPAVAWLVATFPARGPDGTVRDAIFDELPGRLASLGGQLALGEAGPHGTGDISVPVSRLAQAAVPLVAALEPVMARRPVLAAVAGALATALGPVAAAYPLDLAGRLRAAIAAFEARRIVWRIVLRRLRPRLLIVTDAGFRAGEIAAAKECGIPVVEFQHGLFGPRCPDYGWPGAFRAHRAAMPLPDRLAVFGPVFRRAALSRGFWPDDAVAEVGNGTIDRFAALTTAVGAVPTGRRRVLFLTQNLNRAEAEAFWSDYGAGAARGIFPTIDLTIKVHPAEAGQTDFYRRLAARVSPRYRVAEASAPTHRLIGEHDVVVSFTSNALVEAAALGRPAVSLSCAQTPGGLLGLCPLPDVRGAIRTMTTPDEFAAFVAAPLPSPPGLRSALYAPGFLDRATAVILGALRREYGLDAPFAAP